VHFILAVGQSFYYCNVLNQFVSAWVLLLFSCWYKTYIGFETDHGFEVFTWRYKQVGIIWNGIASIKQLEKYSAPILIVLSCTLLAWAYIKAGGFGPILSAPSQFVPGGAKAGQFWQVFFPALTANVGCWVSLTLNIPGRWNAFIIYIYIYYELPASNVDPYVQDLQLLLLEQLYV